MTVEGHHRVPARKLLRDQSQPSRWRSLLAWRDWSIPAKLAAVILVPIVIALALGITAINDRVQSSNDYQRVDRLVSLGSNVRTVLDGVQRERAQTAQLLTAGTVGVPPELADVRDEVDSAVPQLSESAKRAGELEGRTSAASGRATDQLGRLASIRAQVGAGELGPEQAITQYSAVTASLMDLDSSVVAGIGDEAIGSTPSALHNLQVAKEEATVSKALVDFGIARGMLTPSAQARLSAADVRFTDRVDEFRVTATPQQRADFDNAVPTDASGTRDRLVKTAVGEGGSPNEGLRVIPPQEWADSSTAVVSGLRDVSGRLGNDLSSTSSRLVEQASSAAGTLAVVLFAAVVFAAAVVYLITRQLLRSLRVLKASAQDVADTQLPAAVHNIQAGRSQGTDAPAVPVSSHDEIGEVAESFDAVHQQALRLAVEQAAMRTGYGSVFVNLSRRSQSLVQRQLHLIDRLEKDEEDEEQLSTLFQLDHLATRMRRNNENLMVLSGSESSRRSSQPVSTSDVLRASVSEIEQYQRVVVQPAPDARVVGYAASDLMRLIAELLDNATGFSAPDTQVTVATQRLEDAGLSIDIVDEGIGMSQAEVTEANNRLTEAAPVDLATSRRMGLFVVGRLASRHSIRVGLHGGKDIAGVRATIAVPASLMVEAAPPAEPVQREEAGPPAGTTLPRRQRPTSGPTSGPTSAASRPAGPAERTERGVGARGTQHGEAIRRAMSTGQQPADTAGATPSSNGSGSDRPGHTPAEVEVSGPALFEPSAEHSTDDQSAPTAPGQASTAEPAAPEQTGTAPDTHSQPAPQAASSPAGSALFSSSGSALSDWWNTATTSTPAESPPRQQRPSTIRETTPIFDETLSVWFREADSAPAEATGELARDSGQESWDFADDENWRTVQAVSQAPPSDFTEAGLPRRSRGEQLLPGSASSATEAAASASTEGNELPVREPADVRGRLSSFQRGVHRARDQQADQQAEQPAQPHDPAPRAKHAEPTPSPAAEQPATPSARPSTGFDEPQQQPAPAPSEQMGGPSHSASAGEATQWTFASDDQWRTARAVSESSPSARTAAGLPRRRRGEQLLPGSASSGDSSPARHPERDAQQVRGRLSSFQQGARRGRHRPAEPDQPAEDAQPDGSTGSASEAESANPDPHADRTRRVRWPGDTP